MKLVLYVGTGTARALNRWVTLIYLHQTNCHPPFLLARYTQPRRRRYFSLPLQFRCSNQQEYFRRDTEAMSSSRWGRTGLLPPFTIATTLVVCYSFPSPPIACNLTHVFLTQTASSTCKPTSRPPHMHLSKTATLLNVIRVPARRS